MILTIFLWTLAVLATIYLAGYLALVGVMFFQPDPKFGRWWVKGRGPNFTKLTIALVFCVIWPLLAAIWIREKIWGPW